MVRESVPYLDHDEALTDYIEAAASLLREGRLLEALPDGDLNWEL
jgi:histidine ammonia-lyase